MTWEKIKSIFKHGVTTAVASVFLSSVASATVSFYVASATMAPSQNRSMRLERLSVFSLAADQFLSFGTQIVPKLNSQSNLADTKIAIANASGTQAANTEGVDN